MKRFVGLRQQWDRVLGVGTTMGGLLLLLIGYVRISGTPFPAEQLPYLLSCGLGAVFLLGVGGTLWLSADLRDEWIKLDQLAAQDEELVRLLRASLEEPLAGTDRSTPAPRPVRQRRAVP